VPLLSPQAPFKLTHGNLAKTLSVSVEYFSKKRERRKERMREKVTLAFYIFLENKKRRD